MISARLKLILPAALALFAASACSRSAPDPVAAAPAAESAADQLARQQLAGKRTFDRVCATCHQANGQGVPGAFPPLAGSELLLNPDPKHAVLIVLHGLQGPIEVRGQIYNSVMPAQGSALSDREIADVLTYARTAWDNRAPAIDPTTVAELRRTFPRTTFWTWEELRQR